MKEKDYIKNHYPKDFILIKDEFYPLPDGFKLEVETLEIGSTFTTADGTKRKDTIRTAKKITLQYETLLETDIQNLKTIILNLNKSDYDTVKKICIKQNTMPPKNQINTILSHFKYYSIDIISPLKYTYKHRKNNFFIYSGITIKIN